MADRERSRDRPSHVGHHHQASSSGSGGTLAAFLPGLFGRRPAAATTRASLETVKAGEHHSSSTLDEVASPRGRSHALPPISTDAAKKRERSPAPFDPESVIGLIAHADPKDEAGVAETAELVKAIAVHLVDRVTVEEDFFSSVPAPKDPHHAIGVTSADLQTLYIKAIQLANPRAAKPLRTAAKRLLAALIAIAPPEGGTGTIAVHLADSINTRSLYRIITTPAAEQGLTPSIDEIFVEVGALNSLTRNGTDVYKTEGMVGWLVRTVDEMTGEWAVWCGSREEAPDWEPDNKRQNPFSPIKPANPAEAVVAIIDLISSIVSTHGALFSSDDLRRILDPMLALFLRGVSTELFAQSRSYDQVISGLPRYDSPASSNLNSPAPPLRSELGLDANVRRSASTRRGRLESGLSQIVSTPKTARGQPAAEMNSPLPTSPSVRSPSPPKIAQPPARCKWSQPIPSFCSFLEVLIRETDIPDDVFSRVVVLICLALGQAPSETAPETEAALGFLRFVLEADVGRRAELAFRQILEGDSVLKNHSLPIEAQIRIMVGAVQAAHIYLKKLEASAAKNESLARCPFASISDSLNAALSVSHGQEITDSTSWEQVDQAVLNVVLDHVEHLASMPTGSTAGIGDAWSEGEAICEVLEAILPTRAIMLHPDPRQDRPHEASPIKTTTNGMASRPHGESVLGPGRPASLLLTFATILAILPNALEHLQASSSGGPPFVHPNYISLLLKMASSLDETQASAVVSFYETEYLCLPFTSGWIENIWKLLDAFYLTPSRHPSSVSKVSKLLFSQVYVYTEDLPEHRSELVEKVVVPFLEIALLEDAEEGFQRAALDVLISAAVSETLERDEEKRRRRDEQEKRGELGQMRAEDVAVQPSQDIKDAAASGSFHAIRALIIKIAVSTQCMDEAAITITSPQLQTAATMLDITPRKDSKARESTGGGGLMSLVGTISPSVKAAPLPSIASVTSPISAAPEDLHSIASSASHHHMDCRSLRAVIALIAIFSRLSFSPPHSLVSSSKAARTPASARCITIYRDLLGLLFPMTDDQPSAKQDSAGPKIPARCPRARVAILQWLMRLRADNRHRIYVRSYLDESVIPFAAMLYRTRDTLKELGEIEERRRPRTSAARAVVVEEERGRQIKGEKETTRSRSRSAKPVIRAPVVTSSNEAYNPLWLIPQPLPFEFPPDEQRSEGLTTYDPNHPSLRDPDAPPVEGVWLPVSEYIRVLNGILRGHDWELVSYVLCFLPLQLRNKTFFHGGRAVREVRALLDVLCRGVLGTDGRWEKRYNVPAFINRVAINSTAYQSLSILISYRGVFRQNECDQLVQAFIVGLEGRKELAKPALQALTLCIYELEQLVSRHLLVIVERMQLIVTTTALAVHILEFIIALGQHGSLYRNFTDEQYRRVFHVALDYITIHNGMSDQPIDLSKPGAREDYTLSQHVIGLAYYSIYIWFMALRLPQRPNLVPEITRKLLQGRSQRTGVDEMAEVCFDWLARYTYGNADPKPASSFLSEVVMQGQGENGAEAPKQSWLLGGAIITVTAHARSGWATIATTRPTGMTAVVCKLENVPLLEVGEANADLVSLPAVLMANRRARGEEDGAGKGSELEDPKQLSATKSTAPEPDFNHASQHGYIWSGATPSQRRKDVVIDPSYLGLQLLSAYPNANLDMPRGRPIPKDDRFERALRGINNTPVIDTLKIAVLYVGPGQSTETEILGNIDGSPLYLDFLSGLGRLIRLKGQVDVFVGGLNRDNDSDGEYAYAWWDDFSQAVFHTPTMMPNLEGYPNFENKKRLVGNDYVKIVYNESGRPFEFDTIKTAWNFVNIVIQPLTLGDADFTNDGSDSAPGGEAWADWDRQEWFKVELQRCPGIPEFSPIGEAKLVSRRAMPILVRQMAHLANDMAARFTHIRDADPEDPGGAEYITSWRSRLRGIARLRASLPAVEVPKEGDVVAREELLRDFTRTFSIRPAPEKE